MLALLVFSLVSFADEESPELAVPVEEAALQCPKGQMEIGERCVMMPAFVRLEPGTVRMGSPKTELGRGADEVQRDAEIRLAYGLATTEVTVEQYVAVMGDNPAATCGGKAKGQERFPVWCVSWNDAVEFCNRFSEMIGMQAAYRVEDGVTVWDRSANGFRLPTEVEWEFAARAGSATIHAGSDNVDLVGWHAGNTKGKPSAVAGLRPNKLGFFDLSGNLAEWTWDAYATKPKDVADDGAERTLRGGSFGDEAARLRVAARDKGLAYLVAEHVGFRLARSLQIEQVVEEVLEPAP
jgi:formylglycine-generating enzyme